MAAVDSNLPKVYLARHGETEWTKTGQHTGRTDIALTPQGEDDAKLIGLRVAHLKFTSVFTSPLQRAKRTSELAGFAALVDPDLMEWDYGSFEGKKTADIRKVQADWQLLKHGAPNGETAQQVAARADRVIAKVKALTGNVLIFAHGHYLRVFASRWVGADPAFAQHLLLGTSSISVLSFDHGRIEEPAIMLWNDDRHLSGEGCVIPVKK
ncbi:histidine phosphatase family protein [Limnoglobus roseus]|uniref:Histidine phosphatase family protein n=1 Tax=Limnoglobus roseus TaxID=2598579 RepID=A0A5C1A8W4_9BACT|nr:histidine phosphatase family protein [Limnoglobus roseus]QEL14476.1 histidine phosphatase family protein [Limnoglobus roseus]